MNKKECKLGLKKFIETVDFARTTNSDTEKIFFKTELFASIAFVKEFYHFDILKKIEAVLLNENEIQLDYTLDNYEDEESVILSFIVKDRASSIKNLFDNADKMEQEIAKKYNIHFS